MALQLRNQIRLGTRRSLLAMAQSGWVAKQLEKLTPGLKVELVGIETQGDRIQDVSLRKVEGKEFFVAELDQALLEEKVDLTDHSMKDLSLDRPEEILLAAVPVRANPRDLIFFSEDFVQRAASGEPLRVGTSAPRRLENLPSFLESVMPFPVRLEWVEIRGNVNTRLARLNSDSGDKKIEAVVLAAAGISRLYADAHARIQLEALTRGKRKILCPLREHPSAPAQGALAVECRAKDDFMISLLQKIHHPQSAEHAQREREILREWGGGCHQSLGVASLDPPEFFSEQDSGKLASKGTFGRMLYIKGKRKDQSVFELRLERGDTQESFSLIQGKKEVSVETGFFDGSALRDELSETIYLSEKDAEMKAALDAGPARNVFLAHSRAVRDSSWKKHFERHSVWTSGYESWKRLSKLGIWVDGCAEGLGYQNMVEAVFSDPLFQDSHSRWTILTHEGGELEWRTRYPLYEVLTPYRVHSKLHEFSPELVQKIQSARYFYWSSGSQFDQCRSFIPQHAHHSCGSGKTYRYLRSLGIEPRTFPSSEEWFQWLNQTSRSI